VADLDDAKAFANNAYNPKYELLVRQRDIKLANAAARMAARGAVSSSGMVREAADIFAETIHEILHARADALLEGVELYDIPIDEINLSIVQELQQLKIDLVRTSQDRLEGLKYLQTLGMGAYMGGELDRAGNRALSEIRANIERRRLSKSQAAASPNVTNVYHVSGQSVRINTNSTDNSVNIVSVSQEEVFTTLKQEVVGKIQEGEARTDILLKLDALQKAQGTKSFGDRYTEFISAAANHMTVIGPFIPALTELLRAALGG
jgi:hypothetical protein